MNRNDIIENITNSLRAQLSGGVLPWRKCWKAGIPANWATKKYYRGMNFLSLSLLHFPSPYYLTFLQCKQLDGQILKGAKGAQIIYWSAREIPDDEMDLDKSTKRVPILKHSYVFNLSQTSLYEPANIQNTNLQCEELIRSLPEKPVIVNNTMRCAYSATKDIISIPLITDFDPAEEYYSALFHELIHWSGHATRLNRFNKDTNTAVEELIAEIGSAYLCGLCGIEPAVLENQAAYIHNWLSMLSNEPNSFMNAVTKASEAVEFIINGQGNIRLSA